MPLLIPDLPVTSGTPFIRVVRTATIAMLAP